jgi:hypothetical protein
MQAAQTSEVMKIRLSFYNDMLYNYHILANAGDSSVIDSGICAIAALWGWMLFVYRGFCAEVSFLCNNVPLRWGRVGAECRRIDLYY